MRVESLSRDTLFSNRKSHLNWDVWQYPLSSVLNAFCLPFFFLQVIWCHRNLLSMLKNNTAAGNGHARSWACISSRLLCLSSLSLQILCRRQVLSSLQHSPLSRSLLCRQRLLFSHAFLRVNYFYYIFFGRNMDLKLSSSVYSDFEHFTFYSLFCRG